MQSRPRSLTDLHELRRTLAHDILRVESYVGQHRATAMALAGTRSLPHAAELLAEYPDVVKVSVVVRQ